MPTWALGCRCWPPTSSLPPWLSTFSRRMGFLVWDHSPPLNRSCLQSRCDCKKCRLILTWSTRASRRWQQSQAARSSPARRVLPWSEEVMLASPSWEPCRCWKSASFEILLESFQSSIQRCPGVVIWPTGWYLGRWWRGWGERWTWWRLLTLRFYRCISWKCKDFLQIICMLWV